LRKAKRKMIEEDILSALNLEKYIIIFRVDETENNNGY